MAVKLQDAIKVFTGPFVYDPESTMVFDANLQPVLEMDAAFPAITYARKNKLGDFNAWGEGAEDSIGRYLCSKLNELYEASKES